MSKIKTRHSWEFGKTRTTGLVELKFDENGVSQELDDDIAEKLVSISGSLDYVPKDVSEEIQENTEEKVKDTPAPKAKVTSKAKAKVGSKPKAKEPSPVAKTEATPPTDSDEVAEMKSDLTELGDEGVKDLLADAKVPVEDYDNLSGKELIGFAISKLS